MKSFFEEIFEYQNEVNQDMLNQLIDLEIEIPKDILKLISHSLNAQQVWNARILEKKENGVFDIHSLEECIIIDMVNFNDALIVINKFVLQEKIIYKSTSGKKYQNTIQEIFTQISQHFSYHRGQIISKLKTEGINLKPTDFIYYRRREL